MTAKTRQRYTLQELMVVSAARELNDGEVVLVGIGLPVLASMLAQRTRAPNLVMIFESGVVGARPSRMALTMGDPALASGSIMIVDFFEAFGLFLQPGLVDVGFLGGAQVDRFGNINSTVIGDYASPKVRLPGSGGACEIASCAKRVLLICPHEKRRFVERVDFITGPGFPQGRRGRSEAGLRGGGPSSVISTMGVLRFDVDGEMYLHSIHPGVAPEQVRENTGWDLKVSRDLVETPSPTRSELSVLRSLDPRKIFLGKESQG